MINYIRAPLLTRKNTNTNRTHCHPFPFSRVGGVGPINNKKEKESAAVRAQSLYSQEENREPGREVRLSQPEGREDSGLTEPSRIREREKKYEKETTWKPLCRATPRDTLRGRYPPTTKKKNEKKKTLDFYIFTRLQGGKEDSKWHHVRRESSRAGRGVKESKTRHHTPIQRGLNETGAEHSPPTRACSSSSITHRNTIRIFYNSKTKCKNGQPKIVNSKIPQLLFCIIIMHYYL